MPNMNNWDAYMSVEKVASIDEVSTDDFLNCHEFGEELRCCGTGSARECLNRSREFIDRLVDLILELHLVSADFLQCVYAFCPELMCEGDDQSVCSANCCVYSSKVDVCHQGLLMPVTAACPYPALRLDKLYAALIRCLVLRPH